MKHKPTCRMRNLCSFELKGIRVLGVIPFLVCAMMLSAQNYYTNFELFDLLGKHSDKKVLFGNTDQTFEINQFHLNSKSDSLEFVGGCIFSYLNEEVIQICEYQKHRIFCHKSYFRWQENSSGDKYGYVISCNKKGVTKNATTNFYTTETTTSERDSIVDHIKWRVNKQGDTSCRFRHRWVYRNDTLVEYWQQHMDSGDCSWSTQPIITVHKYAYPSPNLTVRDLCYASINRSHLYAVINELRSYDSIGRLVSLTEYLEERENENEETKYLYFYDGMLLTKLEYWYNGKLTEVIEIQKPTLVKRHQ